MDHITVCICTFQRRELLRGLLERLARQQTENRFTYSVVVADNDAGESARDVAEAFAVGTLSVRYCVEPRQNIALIRNKAVENAAGDYIAFIDDDEQPAPDWLVQLVTAIGRHRADGVLGPVVPRFVEPPPGWITQGRILERPSPPSGTRLHWKQTRTGNVLFRRSVFEGRRYRFDASYGAGGEDVELFRRMMTDGLVFVWSREAVVYELVPPERCRRSYLLRRALLRGRAPYNQGWSVAKSLVAVPLYAAALPVLQLFGHHLFMRYLIRGGDHLGRILAALGWNVLGPGYVSK